MNERELLKDDVYLDVAASLSRLSKDRNTKIGAVIVASDGTPVSWGYNGTIAGFPDDEIPHTREAVKLTYTKVVYAGQIPRPVVFESNKYPFMSHAESNAIFFADREKLVGSTLYITGFPCEICAKEIARAKIDRVVVKHMQKSDGDSLVTKSQESDIVKFIFAKSHIQLTVDGERMLFV